MRGRQARDELHKHVNEKKNGMSVTCLQYVRLQSSGSCRVWTVRSHSPFCDCRAGSSGTRYRTGTDSADRENDGTGGNEINFNAKGR